MDGAGLANRVNALCKKKGLAIGSVESRAGLSQGMISRWRRQGVMPGFEKIMNVANAMEVSVEELLYDAPEDMPESESFSRSAAPVTGFETGQITMVKPSETGMGNSSKTDAFVNALEIATRCGELKWEQLSFRKMDFNVNSLYNPEQFRFRDSYYAHSGDDGFVLTIQWNDAEDTALAALFDLTLFTLPYDDDPIVTCEDSAKLIRLLKLIDKPLSKKIGMLRMCRIQDEFIAKYS